MSTTLCICKQTSCFRIHFRVRFAPHCPGQSMSPRLTFRTMPSASGWQVTFGTDGSRLAAPLAASAIFGGLGASGSGDRGALALLLLSSFLHFSIFHCLYKRTSHFSDLKPVPVLSTNLWYFVSHTCSETKRKCITLSI